MRNLVCLILLFATVAASRGYEFKLYAMFTEETRVELSDGAVWMMDKGDVFPVEAYKNMQKNIVLRLAGATFMTESARVRILTAVEVPAGIEKYRENVRSYLDSTSKKIEDKLKTGTGKLDPAKAEAKQEVKGEGEPKPAPSEAKKP